MSTEVFARGRFPVLRLAGKNASEGIPSPRNRKTRILLVEDDRITRTLGKALLRRAGYAVFVAANGLDAVDAVRKHAIDVVLMDIVMPVMDGIEAATEIRRLPKPKGDIPIIAVTAHALDEVGPRCAAAGMNAQLSKPYQQDLLVQAIEAQLERSRTAVSFCAPAHAAAVDGGGALDGAQLGSLESAFGREEVRGLISTYRFNANARFNLLQMCVLNGDGKCIARQAHAIVGMAGNVGAREVGTLAHLLEKTSLRGERDKLDGLMLDLAAALKRSFVALNAWQSLTATGIREKASRKPRTFGERKPGGR